MTAHTLVLDGDGTTGRRVVERLAARGVRAQLGGPDFDWDELREVDAVFVSRPRDGSFAEQAVAHGVGRLVLLSSRGDDAPEAEQAVRRSAAEWTILRAGWLDQELSESPLAEALLGDDVALPAPQVGEPFVDAGDVADVAVAALTEDGHGGRVYELTGPRLLTFAEAVEELAAAARRRVHYRRSSTRELETRLEAAGVPAASAARLAHRFDRLDGRNAHLADGVRRALGREPRDFAEFAREAATTGVWNRPAKGYALPNDWDLAERRLALLEASHDPSSIRRAELLGVGPGWHCLEAGAGGGSFSRWLATRVGDEGRVVAADLDVAVLEQRAPAGVEIRQMDLVGDELPEAEFDLVHTRLVLLHVPARDEVLRRLVTALRPGGILMVEEDDVFSLAASGSDAYRAGWDAFLTTMEAAGVNGEWARRLPERLDCLGLTGVGAEVDTQLFRGGSEPAQFWNLTWLQVRDRIVATGVPARVVDEARAALDDRSLWFYGPAKVIAWGRRC